MSNELAVAFLSLIVGFIVGGGVVAWYLIGSAYRRARKLQEDEAEVYKEMEKLFHQAIETGAFGEQESFEAENKDIKITGRKIKVPKKEAKSDKSSKTN